MSEGEVPDPAVGEFVTELTSHASAFLFGRRTFSIFRGYWPDQTDPANPIATAINSLPKYVVSGSLSQADATWRGEHPDTAHLVTGDVAAAVQALKDEPGDELQIWGSSQLLQTLLQHELVDRFRLMTFPLVLGSGRRLFNVSSRCLPGQSRLQPGGRRGSSRGRHPAGNDTRAPPRQ